jgi:hypothetical protein
MRLTCIAVVLLSSGCGREEGNPYAPLNQAAVSIALIGPQSKQLDVDVMGGCPANEVSAPDASIARAVRVERIANETYGPNGALPDYLYLSVTGVGPGRTKLTLDRCQHGLLDVMISVH